MLNPDYRDMLSALSDAEAEFVVVGAFALAAHGNPRPTGDDVSIPVLSRELLIRNKRAVGRTQDLADVAWLESHPE